MSRTFDAMNQRPRPIPALDLRAWVAGLVTAQLAGHCPGLSVDEVADHALEYADALCDRLNDVPATRPLPRCGPPAAETQLDIDDVLRDDG